MRLRCILERVGLPGVALDLASLDQREHLIGHFEQVGALRRISEERRPRGVKRALLRQKHDIERGDRPRRAAEAHEHAARREAIERRGKRLLADGIVDDRDALTAGGNWPHNAGTVGPEGRRQRHLVKAAGVIGIDEVQAARRLAYARFARPGLADSYGLPLDDFGTAGLAETNVVGHRYRSSSKKK